MERSLIKKLCLIAPLVILVGLFLLPHNIIAQTKAFENLVYITNDKTGIDSFRKNTKFIDIIAPQSYTLNYNLNVVGSVADEIKNIAKNNNVKVMPLIVNANFNQTLIHKLLISATSTKSRIIDFLITEAKKNNYRGWQFDFEHIYQIRHDHLVFHLQPARLLFFVQYCKENHFSES